MTMAGVWRSRMSTVAGVRAVATLMSAPRSVSCEMVCAVKSDMRLSGLSRVPSRSDMNSCDMGVGDET